MDQNPHRSKMVEFPELFATSNRFYMFRGPVMVGDCSLDQ